MQAHSRHLCVRYQVCDGLWTELIFHPQPEKRERQPTMPDPRHPDGGPDGFERSSVQHSSSRRWETSQPSSRRNGGRQCQPCRPAETERGREANPLASPTPTTTNPSHVHSSNTKLDAPVALMHSHRVRQLWMPCRTFILTETESHTQQLSEPITIISFAH